MEKMLQIQELCPLTERTYTDKNGQPKVFASRGVVLTNGIDSFYAELTEDLARRTDFKAGEMRYWRIECTTRRYTDKNGVQRFSNEFYVRRVSL